MLLITRNIDSHNPHLLSNQVVKQEHTYSDLQKSDSANSEQQVALGKWNQAQNFDFVIFVTYYQDIFSSKPRRKSCKIFKIFEGYLKERTAAQCRSHFQKMMLRFKTVAKIRKYYEKQYGKQSFLFKLNEFKTSWERTHPPLIQKDPTIKSRNEIAIQTDVPSLIKEQQQICSTCCQSLSEQVSFQKHEDFFYNLQYWNQFYSQNMGGFYFMPSGINSPHQF